MVVVGGFGQALTLPMITAATIFFRYRKLDRRLTPALILDICLWVALVSITVVAAYALYSKFNDLTATPPPAAVTVPGDATAPAAPAPTAK